MTDHQQQLRIAVQAALDKKWETAHQIAQDYSDSTANWLHAVLHKIEGDKFNSNYWYARTDGRKFEDFTDTNVELHAIEISLSN